MKIKLLYCLLLILAIMMNFYSCGLIDEEKCKNEKVLTKSWSGDFDKLYNAENSPNVFFKLNESGEASKNGIFNYVFHISDACPYGALAIRITIHEKEGLAKPNGYEEVPKKYNLIICEEKNFKGNIIWGKSSVKSVDRNKITGIVELNADIELDGFLEGGARKYLIILGINYPDIPGFGNYKGLVVNNIKKVDFKVDYLQF